jgi:hypothetical protein
MILKNLWMLLHFRLDIQIVGQIRDGFIVALYRYRDQSVSLCVSFDFGLRFGTIELTRMRLRPALVPMRCGGARLGKNCSLMSVAVGQLSMPVRSSSCEMIAGRFAGVA